MNLRVENLLPVRPRYSWRWWH